ncbi:MAG: hypothetical protein Q8P31_04475 [Bacillota bacterium]|nr:hypothetical protein [Bacillota bacterium]
MSGAAGAYPPSAKADAPRHFSAGGESPDADALISVLVAVPAGALRAGSAGLTPSSLRSLVRDVRAAHPQLAARPLAEVGLVRGSTGSEVRLFFGCREGERGPSAK